VAEGPEFCTLYFDGRKCGKKEQSVLVRDSDYDEWVLVPNFFNDHFNQTYTLVPVEEPLDSFGYHEKPFQRGKKYVSKHYADNVKETLEPGEVPAFLSNHLVYEARGSKHYFFTNSIGNGTQSVPIDTFKKEDWYELAVPETKEVIIRVYDNDPFNGDPYTLVSDNGRGGRCVASVKMNVTFLRNKYAIEKTENI
jgi:hypothetical protein